MTSHTLEQIEIFKITEDTKTMSARVNDFVIKIFKETNNYIKPTIVPHDNYIYVIYKKAITID
jgi:hypothetical protein